MKALIIGDVHAKKSNREETGRLLYWSLDIAEKSNLPMIFLGDQFNDFGVVRVELIDMWCNFVRTAVSEGVPVKFLVGNHDYNSDCTSTSMSALYGFEKAGVSVIEAVTRLDIDDSIVYAMPFYKENIEFIRSLDGICDLHPEAPVTVLCHQTIDGSKYDNGFWAPDGADISAILQKKSNINIISGHIHTQQDFSCVWYPGTPRCLTRSDANKKKGVWIYDFSTTVREFIETPSDVCPHYHAITYREGDDIVVPDDGKLFVDIYGDKSYTRKVISRMPDHAVIRTFIAEESIKNSEVKESEGIPIAFKKFSKSFAKKHQIPTEKIDKAYGKISEMCPILKEGNDG